MLLPLDHNKSPNLQPKVIPMDTMSLMLIDAPQLSDEAAAEMLSFLQEFSNAFEIQYFTQLRRYYQSHESP